MWQGTFTALITPFASDGSIDETAFAQLIEAQIAAKVEGIVIAGTTGESPTLTHQENIELVRLAVEIVNGGTKVIAGTGSNSTNEAICMTKKAAEIGADAALLVVPYYNKPSQEGLFLHYQAIAKCAPDLPIILYDVPGRSGIRFAPETIVRLAQISNIVALKDATGSLDTFHAVFDKLPADFSILSGDDALTLSMIRAGGKGVIAVASNIVPAQMKALVDSALSGDFAKAEAVDAELQKLFELCFVEANPIPIKWMLALQKKCKPVYRLPLCAPSAEHQEQLAALVKTL